MTTKHLNNSLESSGHTTKYGSIEVSVQYSLPAQFTDRTTESSAPGGPLGAADDDNKAHQQQQQHSLRAVLLAYFVTVASMGLYALGVVCVQLLDGAIAEFQLSTWRFVLQAVMVMPIVAYKNCSFRVQRQHIGRVSLVVVIFFLFNLAFYSSAKYLPVGNLAAMCDGIMITFNAFLSICIKEERSISLYLAAGVAVFAITLMTQPDFLFSSFNLPAAPTPNWTSPCNNVDQPWSDDVIGGGTLNSTFSFASSDETPTDVTAVTAAAQIALSSSMLGYILITSAGLIDSLWYQAVGRAVRAVHAFTLIFWVGFFCALLSAIMMFSLEPLTFPSNPICILLLLGHCIGTTQAAVITPSCMVYLSPSVCAMVNSLHLVLLIVLQYTVLAGVQPGNGNWVEILGGALCLIAVTLGPLWHIISSHRKKQAAPKDTEKTPNA